MIREGEARKDLPVTRRMSQPGPVIRVVVGNASSDSVDCAGKMLLVLQHLFPTLVGGPLQRTCPAASPSVGKVAVFKANKDEGLLYTVFFASGSRMMICTKKSH